MGKMLVGGFIPPLLRANTKYEQQISFNMRFNQLI